MKKRWISATILGLSLLTTPLLAQNAEEITPDQIQALAARLKGITPSLDPRLLDAIKKFKNQNPGINERQFAEDFLNKNPQFKSKQFLDQFQKFMKDSGGKLPDNIQLPKIDPANPPPIPSIPPASTQLPKTTPPTLPPDVPTPPGVEPIPGQPPKIPFPNGEVPLPNLPPPNGNPWDAEKSFTPSEQRQRQMQSIMEAWEKNVGPLKDTPAVQQAFRELFLNQPLSNGEGGLDLNDLMSGTNGDTLGDFADTAMGQGSWSLPEVGLSEWKWDTGGGSGFSAPDLSSGSSFSPGSFQMGSSSAAIAGGSWLSVILLAVFAALALVLWYLWPKLMKKGDAGPQPLPGLGPWPLDPRSIRDRESLVKAFEYLSVTTCGTAARTWNHVTIADHLRKTIPSASSLADPLARLYAVARYTPADEPLPPAAITEARHHLCTLAGVPVA